MARTHFFVLLISLMVYLQETQQNKSDELVSVTISSFTSSSGPQTETISKDCQMLGYCEKSKSYPKELANTLRKEVKEWLIDTDDRDFIRKAEIKRNFSARTMAAENMCVTEKKVITPVMVQDIYDSNTWYYTLNEKGNEVQQYLVDVCDTAGGSPETSISKCYSFNVEQEWKLQCVQKSIIRTIVIIKKGKAVSHPVKIPCCCSCVVVTNNLDLDNIYT